VDLTNTNLSSKGLITLFTCFKKCAALLDHLTYLNISDNRLDQEGSGVLAQWLALPNFKLRTVKLANTQAHLPLVIPAVQRGCLRLMELDVSKNRFTDKVRPALVRLLQGNDSLQRIALNGTGLSAEALVEILSTVHGNNYLAAIAIEAAENNFGPAGAAVIGTIYSTFQFRQFADTRQANNCVRCAV
jgi:Ran GTPase-activating protein (RanGAP) involved in mRNA processing and transport